MKKRFLSAFLALALIVSLCPTAFAPSGQIKASLSSAQVKQGEKVSIQFKLDENKVRINKYVPESIISELYDPMCEPSFRKYKPNEKEERKN